jgi:CHAT domain-containing protein
LTDSEAEAEHAIARSREGGLLESSTSLRAAGATEERLKAELPLHELVVLATHAAYQSSGRPFVAQGPGSSGPAMLPDLPSLRAYLVCAGANLPCTEGQEDGLLTAEEIEWLDLSRCRMAVLSACMSGLGEPVPGEGLHSLSRAFHLAGVHTVISSLWNVHDDETCLLMRSFHRRLWKERKGALEALREAQLERLAAHRAGRGSTTTLRWGAFVLSGDWR